MLKPAAITADQFATQPQGVNETTVNNVFKVMHGYYGNLFLSKFATGVVDSQGRDMGVKSARTIWAHSLRDIAESVVLDALTRCQTAHPEFPPALPQFLALCRAAAPRVAYEGSGHVIGMSTELKQRNAARAREINARHDRRKQSQPGGELAGLPVLKVLIAGAIATAGGDEVAALRRMDRMYPCQP
ncbi:MAG: hypothetical protein V4614_15030 [Pseudomonadota bacterium]